RHRVSRRRRRLRPVRLRAAPARGDRARLGAHEPPVLGWSKCVADALEPVFVARAAQQTNQQDLFASLPPPVVAPAEEAAPKPEGPKTLTMVDASGFIFRAYHALPPLTTSKGVPSHAVLGFTRMLLKLIRERQPTHLVLCFDKDSRRGRLEIDPQYKANREAPPADLMSQFGLIRKVADVLNLPIVEVEGWEADDVIATLAKHALAQGWRAAVVTSDKDFLQMLREGATLDHPMKDLDLDDGHCLERHGVKPSQVCDDVARVGDPI